MKRKTEPETRVLHFDASDPSTFKMDAEGRVYQMGVWKEMKDILNQRRSATHDQDQRPRGNDHA